MNNVIDKDKGWNKWVAGMVRAEKGIGVAVGIMGAAVQRDEGELDNATLGAIHEFGKGVVPERSFLRSTVDENTGDIRRMEAEAGKRVDSTMRGDLMLMGEKVRAKVVEKINARIPPPLTDATQARKKRYPDIPLKDSGQLVRSMDSRVVEGEELKRMRREAV